MSDAAAGTWQQTACILCSINCGIEVRLDGRRFERIRGDKAHPASQGYTCEKALRLDHYQNGGRRLTSPLRRRADGAFEEIDWDTAINEVAARFAAIRDTYGGASILYYGGGGQGNHLGGAYSGSTRRALGAVYSSNALAQEKTGEFWVDGRLFGRQDCHTTADFERAEVAVFVGKNPWQSHGFPRARAVLKAIANDPERTLVVIDPRRSETAQLALDSGGYHLAVRPGTDAFALAALGGVLVQEGLVDRTFLAQRTVGADEVLAALAQVPVGAYAACAGVDEALVRAVARRLASASSVATFEDLGVQQAPHSTLSSYLEKLLYLLTGNFGRPGTMNIHTHLVGLFRHSAEGPDARRSPVHGHRVIAGLIPSSAVAEEILTDHPARFRAALIESANPAHSLPDSPRMRAALDALDLVVVIDVAMTETARHAHYVLPAASQFEKWEATFFTLESPHNVFHLRRPVLDPLPGTLPEPEIHRRLVRALGALTDDDVAPLAEAARQGRAAFAEAFFAATAANPQLGAVAPVVLYETLGATLPDGAAAAAVLWGAAHRCALTSPEAVARAGFGGEGLEPGEQLFDAILTSPSGVVFTVDAEGDTWRRIAHADGLVHLAIPELLTELDRLADEPAELTDEEYPLVLSAGERRSSTANTIFRDPTWRKKDVHGALRVSPADADRFGLVDGGEARVTTKRGSVTVTVEVSDTMQAGHVSLPNGLGLAEEMDGGGLVVTGAPPNELTALEDRDWLAGTPWHKHVPARVEPLSRMPA